MDRVVPMPQGLDLTGQLVKVHQNLNNGMWTVKHGSNPVFHVHACCIRRASFHVSKAGRERVRLLRQRAVHAWVEGIWCEPPFFAEWPPLASYNPFKPQPFFYYQYSMQPVYTAAYALFTPLRLMHIIS